MLLTDKVCLITGTSRGIGAGILERFVSEGAVVYAVARKEGCLDTPCERLSQTGPGQAFPVYFDVTDTAAVKECVMRIKKEQGRIDVLVNNAGIMQDGLIGMISHDLMRDVFETNVFAVMEMLQYVSKIMKRGGAGSIINFASIAGTAGSAGQMVYSASKGAVVSLTKAAAKELAADGIRVNAVSPGMIDTDLFHSIGQERVDETLGSIAMGRLGTPRDVADTCVYLASDLSQYVTGQVIGIDGGAVM